MPKMKTKKAAAKRYKVSGSGKVVGARSGRRHLMSHKSRKKKRQLHGVGPVDVTKQKQAKKLLPYS